VAPASIAFSIFGNSRRICAPIEGVASLAASQDCQIRGPTVPELALPVTVARTPKGYGRGTCAARHQLRDRCNRRFDLAAMLRRLGITVVHARPMSDRLLKSRRAGDGGTRYRAPALGIRGGNHGVG
jgi:hypothetical protein